MQQITLTFTDAEVEDIRKYLCVKDGDTPKEAIEIFVIHELKSKKLITDLKDLGAGP